MVEPWTVKGQYMEACTCDAICPCITLSDPTEGSCTAVVGWHVDDGRFGRVDLSGLNVALALYSPGNMGDGDFHVGLLIDDRASEEQQRAITTIWAGEAGGHPAQLAELISEVAGVEVVPMEYESDGRHKGRIRLGDLGGADWESIEGQGGGAVEVKGHPLAIAPGQTVIVGRASHARFDHFGIRFDVEGRQAMMSPFEYSGP